MPTTFTTGKPRALCWRCLVGVHEGVSLRHPLPTPPPLAVLEPDLALPEPLPDLVFSGMAMKEALASSGPLSTSTRASACA